MLAEPRRKIRYTVNPSGRDWTDAESKFGQRMLERMGWRSGDGLGKQRQGMAEPLKVKCKTDNRGVGCSAAYAEESMPQSQDFTSLLEQLNEQHQDEAAPAPATTRLEEKSRLSRARLHYRRFARAKDVSAYAQADIACIFGRRTEQKRQEEEEVVEDEKEEVKEQQQELRHSASDSCLLASEASGLTLVRSQASLQDYFRAKMQQRAAAAAAAAVAEEPGVADDEEEEAADWTSESSCSQPSSGQDSPPNRKRRRVHFGLPSSPSPPSSPPPQSPKSDAEGQTVIDFRLFPDSRFASVLGYPYY